MSANIIHVPGKLTRPELTANMNPREHGFVSESRTLIPANINEFTVWRLSVLGGKPIPEPLSRSSSE